MRLQRDGHRPGLCYLWQLNEVFASYVVKLSRLPRRRPVQRRRRYRSRWRMTDLGSASPWSW